MEPIRLGVNVDHVATLRQARHTPYPDPVAAALVAEAAGADSITVHLREDRRHIQERDVVVLVERLRTRLNLELAVTDDMIEFAIRTRPADCCLVPERREELTTEGGLDVVGAQKRIATVCELFADAGIRVALFVDPDRTQIDAAYAAGVPVVELHTGSYADAADNTTQLARLVDAARYAHDLGLEVHAGHGLTNENVGPVAAIPEIIELNIGHAIVADAVFIGLSAAVTRMRRAIAAGRDA
ncbi:MAG: pyridoxine 5'-phosphate synthase [Gammaproteobacteria bacterium]